MKPRVYIVHCWGGHPGYCWYPWLKRELRARGVDAHVPQMPKPDKPQQDAWVAALARAIGTVGPEVTLIGHSAGVPTILRYLQSLQPGTTVGQVISVAGFCSNPGYPELDNFFTTPFDFTAITSHCPKFTVVTSDNDPFVPVSFAKELADAVGTAPYFVLDATHFSNRMTQVPVLLDAAFGRPLPPSPVPPEYGPDGPPLPAMPEPLSVAYVPLSATPGGAQHPEPTIPPPQAKPAANVPAAPAKS